MKGKNFIFLYMIVFLVVPVFFVSAVEVTNPAPSRNQVTNERSDTIKLANPLGETTTFCALIKKVLDAAFILGLPIAVLFIVLAGFRFVLARGNPEKLKVARSNLLYVVIGIAIFFGAWLLARVIADTITTLGGASIEACQ